MNKKFYPAIGIILVTLVLLLINEYSESEIIEDYAIIFIIAGMLIGNGLSKLSR